MEQASRHDEVVMSRSFDSGCLRVSLVRAAIGGTIAALAVLTPAQANTQPQAAPPTSGVVVERDEVTGALRQRSATAGELTELAAAKAELMGAKPDLAAAKAELSRARPELEAAKREIEEAKLDIASAKAAGNGSDIKVAREGESLHVQADGTVTIQKRQ